MWGVQVLETVVGCTLDENPRVLLLHLLNDLGIPLAGLQFFVHDRSVALRDIDLPNHYKRLFYTHKETQKASTHQLEQEFASFSKIRKSR